MCSHDNSGLNNTYVSDPAVRCSSGLSTNKCTAINGGQFNPDASSTWTAASGMSAAGASPENNPIEADGRWGDELLRINNKFSVPNYPLGVSKNIGSEYHGGVLGLRRNSSLLTRLTSAAVIPSNSYSFWWGLQGAGQPEQMNGNLVLGGIDSAKIGGSNLTRPLSDDGSCASRVIVDITALRVKASDGTKRDLLGKAQLQSIKACVDTTYPIISTPQSVWNAFLAVTGPTPISRALGLDFCGYYSLIGDA